MNEHIDDGNEENRSTWCQKKEKTFSGPELGKNSLKEEVWVNILSGQDNFIM